MKSRQVSTPLSRAASCSPSLSNGLHWVLLTCVVANGLITFGKLGAECGGWGMNQSICQQNAYCQLSPESSEQDHESKRKKLRPCLVWLSGLSAGLRTKGSLVRVPVRVHAWVASQVPSRGLHERQPHIDVSLPLFLLSFLFL